MFTFSPLRTTPEYPCLGTPSYLVAGDLNVQLVYLTQPPLKEEEFTLSTRFIELSSCQQARAHVGRRTSRALIMAGYSQEELRNNSCPVRLFCVTVAPSAWC